MATWYLACANHLGKQNIKFLTEAGVPQIFKGRFFLYEVQFCWLPTTLRDLDIQC